MDVSQLKALSESIGLRDRKSVIDLALRDRMLSLLAFGATDEVRTIIKVCADAAVADLASPTTPFLLFADLFNTIPISEAEDNFQFMEETITALKDVSMWPR